MKVFPIVENFNNRIDYPSPLEKLSNDVYNDDKIDITQLDKPLNDSKQILMCDGTDQNKEIITRKIICLNERLEDDVHPITGVPFERKQIEHNGEIIDGVFPVFKSECTVQLPEDLYEARNKDQFDYANNELRKAVESDPELRALFTEEQLEQIENGDRPDGYVWHHSENPGELQLVDRDIHDKTGHTGGQAVWGGGTDNR